MTRGRKDKGNNNKKPRPKKFDHVKKTYAFYSRFYDLVWGRVFNQGRRRIVKWIEDRHNGNGSSNGLKILEIGCGTGISLPFYPRDFDLHGVDFSEEMLGKARKKINKRDLGNVELACMDAADLDFGDSEFDVVVMAYLISTVPEPHAVMREARRVCKPGGTIYIVNHFRQDKPIIGRLEKVFSPVALRLGWVTDLELDDLLTADSYTVSRHARVNLLKMWDLVEIIND